MEQSVLTKPRDCAAVLDEAIGDYMTGRAGAARAACLRILEDAGGQPDALHLLGVLALDRGDKEEALRLVDAALAGVPERPVFLNTRGRVLQALGRLGAAEEAYRAALAVRPDLAEIGNNLGCLLRDRGDLGGALEWLSRAFDSAPQSVAIAGNLADALVASGSAVAGVALFEHALSLGPDAELRHRYGRALVSLGRLDAAAGQFRGSIGLRPDYAGAHNSLGDVLGARGDIDGARRSFEAAVRCDPACADAWHNLGCMLLLDGEQEGARECHDRALAADRLHGPALWARCTVELPVVYESGEQVARQRARYAEQLAWLVAKAESPAVARALAAAAGSSQPFFLPYGGEDDRELQAAFGGLVAQVLSRGAPVALAGPPAAGEPIRVGIVSGWFCEHTIWHLFLRGWLSGLDPDVLQVSAYHTGPVQDGRTAEARKLCRRFMSGGAAAIRAAIASDRPHVLLYPEIGMDPVSCRLAGERLAPLQCVAWGHPETTGLPTIDVFLSSEMMEPADAEGYYTERLVKLPNIGAHYVTAPGEAEPCGREQFGLRPGATVFWCGQALYKYLPQYDDALVRIAAGSGDCQFLFIGFAKSEAVTEQVQGRLRRVFGRAGLDAERYCVFAEPMLQGRFLASVRAADVVLDSLGWSGGKSTLDMLAEAPPIVTWPGPYMRGRHTAAILTRAGVTETIAGSMDEYVALAIGLARAPEVREVLRARLAAGRDRVLGDTAALRALEAFLVAEVGVAEGRVADITRA